MGPRSASSASAAVVACDSSNTDEADALAIEVAAAEGRTPVTPRMLTDDVTPEKLAVLLEKNDGVKGIVGEEL